jgi:hypothetical protein
VTDDEDVLLTFELHDDGLKSDDDVSIRFSSSVSVVVLVLQERGGGREEQSNVSSRVTVLGAKE